MGHCKKVKKWSERIIIGKVRGIISIENNLEKFMNLTKKLIFLSKVNRIDEDLLLEITKIHEVIAKTLLQMNS